MPKIDNLAMQSLVRCILKHDLYASDEETAEWLKTPEGQKFQIAINELRARDRALAAAGQGA